jgi:hypothetical protein
VRISKFFVVNYMPNTPVGSLDVNISKLIKLKGSILLQIAAITLWLVADRMGPTARKWQQPPSPGVHAVGPTCRCVVV